MMKTIGQRLKEARKDRHLSLEVVEKEIHIRLQFLRALEADDFSAMPSPVQARGFLRNYAGYLGLDLDAIIAEMRRAEARAEPEPEVVFEQGTAQAPVVDQAVDQAQEEASVDSSWRTTIGRLLGRFRSSPAPRAPVDGPLLADQAELAQPGGTGAPLAEESAPATGMAEEPNSKDDRSPAGGLGTAGWSRAIWGGISSLAGRTWEFLTATFRVRLSPSPQTTDAMGEPHPAPAPPEGEVAAGGDGAPGVSPASSQQILNEIGLQLRERREMLSLSLDEIERHTHLRARYMKALENGDFDELPSTVQTRGMLNNYAGFLDLDVDAILLRFADALQARHRERYPEKPAGRRQAPTVPERLPLLRGFIAGDLVFGVGMILLLIVFAIWGITRVIAAQSGPEQIDDGESGPSISEALIGTPLVVTPTEIAVIPVEDTPLPAAPEGTLTVPTPAANLAVQVNLVVLERTYLRVLVDGEVVFDGRALPGNVYSYGADQSVDVLAGNAAALRLTYNQRDLGLLGGFGELVNLVFTAGEILTPTAVPSPTPTATPPVSPTPSLPPSPTPTVPVEGEAF